MPRGVSKNFIKEWSQRIAHARRFFETKGIHRPGAAGPFLPKNNTADTLKMFLDGYRGKPWADSWGGIDAEDLAVTPTFFSAANTFVAGLLARSPDPEVLPRLAEHADTARIWEAVLKYDADELKFKRQWNAALHDSFFAFGLIRHGFTPTEEYRNKAGDDLLETYAMARPDKPWMRRWRVWDFLCDPLAESLLPDADATWCAFRSLVCLDDVESNPAMTAYDNIPTIRVKMADGGEEPEEFVPLWTVYDKNDRSFFQFAEGDEERKLVRQPADWPIPWEDLPYDICQFNPQMDSMLPIPYAASIWQSVIERNKNRTLIAELAKRMRRIILLREDALSEDSRRKIQNADLTEVLTVTGSLSEALGQVQLGMFDPTLLMLDALYEKDIREAIGQSAMDRGQRINVDSGTEAAGVAQGAAIHASRNIEAVEDFLASTLRHYAVARRATTFGDELIPVVGVSDAALVSGLRNEVRISADTLAGEFDFKIRPGSTLPESRQTRTNEAVADLGIAAQAPQLHNMQERFAAYWRARGKNPAKEMLSIEQMQQTAASQPQGESEGGGDQMAQMLSAMNQSQGQVKQ